MVTVGVEAEGAMAAERTPLGLFSCGFAMQALGDADAPLGGPLFLPDLSTENSTMTNVNNGLPKPQIKRVRITDLTTDEAVFQPRFGGLYATHVAKLENILRGGTELDPPAVWENPETKALVIADGHHRLAAYQTVRGGSRMRVKIYRCDLSTARMLSMTDNSKERLAVSYDEKANFAWQRVVEGAWTKPMIAQISGVSDRTVANQRRVRRELLKRGQVLPELWPEARRLHSGKDEGQWSDDMREQWEQEQLERADKKIGGYFTELIQRKPAVAAALLQRCAGGRLSETLEYIDFYECETDYLTDELIPKANIGPRGGDDGDAITF
jgi:ParB-like chromosome segregation protein Spo0J